MRAAWRTMCVLGLLCAGCGQKAAVQPRAVAPAAAAPQVVAPTAGRVAKPAARPNWQAPAPLAKFYDSPKSKSVDAGVVTAAVATPKGPPPDAMNKALEAAMPALAGCFDGGGAAGTVSVRFDAEPSGRARGIKISGADARAESCIRSTLVTLPLPSFEGSTPIEVDFPLRLERRASPPVERAIAVPNPRL